MYERAKIEGLALPSMCELYDTYIEVDTKSITNSYYLLLKVVRLFKFAVNLSLCFIVHDSYHPTQIRNIFDVSHYKLVSCLFANRLVGSSAI